MILDKESKKCIMENYDDNKLFHFIISIFIAIVFAMILGLKVSRFGPYRGIPCLAVTIILIVT